MQINRDDITQTEVNYFETQMRSSQQMLELHKTLNPKRVLEEWLQGKTFLVIEDELLERISKELFPDSGELRKHIHSLAQGVCNGEKGESESRKQDFRCHRGRRTSRTRRNGP